MSRFLALWLTLLAAYWLTAAAVSALFFQQSETEPEALARVVLVPLLQAVLVAWLTREPGGEDEGADREED